MKKIIFITILLTTLCEVSFSQVPRSFFGKYGIESLATLKEYKNRYTGKKIIYIPDVPPSDKDNLYFDGLFNKPFIINKISGNNNRIYFELKGEDNDLRKILPVENSYKPKFFNNRDSYFRITDYLTIPFFLIDDFNSDLIKFKNLKFSNPMIKGEYQIIEGKIEPNEKEVKHIVKFAKVIYILQNNETGDEIIVKLENLDNDPFKEVLTGKYVTKLINVEKSNGFKTEFSELKSNEENNVLNFNYLDSLIDITISGNNFDFPFILKNNSQNSIKLIWNDAVFVDNNGTTSKVMHIGTKYSQKNEHQENSTIIKGASINDVAIPNINVRYSDSLKEWVTDSMYPDDSDSNPMEVKLMFPIQTNNVTYEYIFTFKIEWKYDYPELIKK